jgi:hypothetical protein
LHNDWFQDCQRVFSEVQALRPCHAFCQIVAVPNVVGVAAVLLHTEFEGHYGG